MDFDEAERERTQRDGRLREDYAQDVKPGTANLYVLPTGKLVSADDALYDPAIVAETLENAFGERWERQNGCLDAPDG